MEDFIYHEPGCNCSVQFSGADWGIQEYTPCSVHALRAIASWK